ncbi:MAG: MFS transporter, partial [Anaerolineales bacterium]|nr:MFS transporter [Anaerolineales bacterium]
GIQRLLILSVAVQAARLLGWSFINEPYAALSLQLLNGLTFGILWLASVAYAKEIAPAGLETTAQGLLSGIYFGFSSMVGALAGGLLYEPIGTWGIYRGGAVVMVIGLVLFILASNLKVKLMARQPLKLS